MNYKIKHDYDCLLKIAVLTNIKNSISTPIQSITPPCMGYPPSLRPDMTC